jgi:isopenicillin-N epimerase
MMISSIDNKIQEQWLPASDGSIYLNNGSCGRKPKVVLDAISQGTQKLNLNPTLFTFLDTTMRNEACQAAATAFGIAPESIMLTSSTTSGLQQIAQSFLLKPGDELVTTDHEHGSWKTICKYLEETRGIVVRRYQVDPLDGSKALCQGMLELVTAKTRLVEVSEIDCFSGWRPDLTQLVDSLNKAQIPLLVDGAHSPGQGPCTPSRYPLWVGSGHKWLGGPNGTGFTYVAPHLIPLLKPVWLGDHYYDFTESNLLRFECLGTTDQVRWLGLTEALKLWLELKPEAIAQRQKELVGYLRTSLNSLPNVEIRTPNIAQESTGMVTFTWQPDEVLVPDLQQTLWSEFRIWVQPDFFYGQQGHGMRISCHPATTEHEIDRLIQSLITLLA